MRTFLSAAVSWAEVLGAETVVIGAVEQDSSGYPDCRPGLLRCVQRPDSAGDPRRSNPGADAPDSVCASATLCGWVLNLDAPLHVSWSCYSAEEFACGVCESCSLRLRAFQEAGRLRSNTVCTRDEGRNPFNSSCTGNSVCTSRAGGSYASRQGAEPMKSRILSYAAVLALLPSAAMLAQGPQPGSHSWPRAERRRHTAGW